MSTRRFMAALSDIIRLIRPVQWIKNTFVFLPLFFGGSLADPHAWLYSLAAFAAFCPAASAIYCLNDVIDAEADRAHPRKRRRPVASGAVSRTAALVTMLVLLILSAFVLYVADIPDAAIVIGVYVLINIAYCLWLKRIPILDVFIVAAGFALRVLAGGVACGIPVSPWIVLMTFLLALFLAFAKRRDDIIVASGNTAEMRPSSRSYSLPFLNQTLGILAAVTIVCYIAYTLSPEVVARLDCPYLYTTAIFVIAGILRYLQLAIVDNDSGSPTAILVHDVFIRICLLLWLATFAIIIYV